MPARLEDDGSLTVIIPDPEGGEGLKRYSIAPSQIAHLRRDPAIEAELGADIKSALDKPKE